MKFYDISPVNAYKLNEIEELLYHWKITNIVTYISSLTYNDDNNISFQIEINDIIYKFSLIYIDKWELSIKSNELLPILINIVDIINNDIISLSYPINLIKILDIIEAKIDETDFD